MRKAQHAGACASSCTRRRLPFRTGPVPRCARSYVGIGFDAAVVQQVARRIGLKRTLGQAVFAYAAFDTRGCATTTTAALDSRSSSAMAASSTTATSRSAWSPIPTPSSSLDRAADQGREWFVDSGEMNGF